MHSYARLLGEICAGAEPVVWWLGADEGRMFQPDGNLEETDPEIYGIIKQEKARQVPSRSGIARLPASYPSLCLDTQLPCKQGFSAYVL